MQHGISSLTVSLPKKWINEFNLKKGDEIELETDADKVTISVKKAPTIMKKRIDVSATPLTLPRRLNALYRGGYDEIEILFDDPRMIDEIHKTIEKEMIGFEIIKQGKNYCIIKDLSGLDYKDFDITLKRSFFLTLDVSKECVNAVQNQDVTALKSIVFRDKSINKFTNFCERSLVKYGYKNFDKTCFYFDMSKKIENIADEYQYISRYCLDNKIKVTPSSIKIFKTTNECLEQFFELFYKFDSTKFETLVKDVIATKEKVKVSILAKHKDAIVLNHLYDILRLIEVALGDHLTIHQ